MPIYSTIVLCYIILLAIEIRIAKEKYAMKLSVALYEPDIAGNTGAILRLAACFNLVVHVIEPTGFDISDKCLRRAGMDYINLVELHRHLDWQTFYSYSQNLQSRLILFTTKASQSYYDFTYKNNDILLFGRESAGVPQCIYSEVHERLTIPIQKHTRSLNLAISVAMAVSVAKYPH